MDILFKYDKGYKKKIELYTFFSENLEEAFHKIMNKFNIDLNRYNYDIVKRITEEGFKMKYHRDNYMLRKVKGEYIFIPFENQKIPEFTLIHYKHSDCTGGSLQFLSGTIIKPENNLFVFFDSNEIHRVNEQLSGKREVYIYKFYL